MHFFFLPVSGTSVGRITLRICSIFCKSGESPPCIHIIFSSITAAIGKQLKQSVKIFQSFILYRRLPIGGENEIRYTKNNNKKLTFIIKSIYTIDTCTFMITTKNKKVFRVFNFVSQQ